MRQPLTRATITIIALCLLLGSSAEAKRKPISSFAPQELAQIWQDERESPAVPALLDHEEVVKRVNEAVNSAPDLFSVEKIGESVEGRSILHVTVGAGPYHALLWSQMHGDESTATAALFDLCEYFREHRNDPRVQRILTRLTLDIVPMLNPDGAERFQRRNAQGIDINRDALRLQTPEGRALKALRDRIKPGVGLNLHNQNWSTSVGDPPKPASITLLSVAFDKKQTVNAGRKLTKKLCAVIRDALEPFAAGQIGRYDEDFEVRAFGDNMTLWGTPVVLIETGPWPGVSDSPLVRLNFVALVTALDTLATGQVKRADPRRYESLPVNESKLYSTIFRNATVITGTGVPPFIADVGVAAARRVQTTQQGGRELVVKYVIEDLGDLRTYGALKDIDATGMTVAPGYQSGQVDLPDWRAKTEQTIAVGQPAHFVVLSPLANGKYEVKMAMLPTD